MEDLINELSQLLIDADFNVKYMSGPIGIVNDKIYAARLKRVNTLKDFVDQIDEGTKTVILYKAYKTIDDKLITIRYGLSYDE